MENNKTDFSTQIMELENLTSTFKQYQDPENFEEVSQMAVDIKARVDKANEYAKMINNRESLTGAEEVTDYSSIPQMNKDFKPYYDLWTTVKLWNNSYHSWLNDAFEELNAASVEEIVDNSNKSMAQVIRFFRDKELPGIMKIAEHIKQNLEDFKIHVPILIALRTDGMKDRHWEMISDKVGFEVKPYEGFTYAKCMEMNLTNWTEQIVDIGEKAGKEYNIETSMAKMKRDWQNVELGLKPFKNTGTSTVTGFDEAMILLDEHIVLTQTMQFSPFKKPFEAEIEEWNATLLYVSECIDEWMKCQGQWMYL